MRSMRQALTKLQISGPPFSMREGFLEAERLWRLAKGGHRGARSPFHSRWSFKMLLAVAGCLGEEWPIVILLCKFKDFPNTEPQPVSYFEDLIANLGTGGVNDYWVTASDGHVHLVGSEVHGWKNIAQTQNEFSALKSRHEMIQTAKSAFENDVDLSCFKSVIVVTNLPSGDGANDGAGGILMLSDYTATWLSHEIGHLFGLRDSADESGRKKETWALPGDYYDNYDIMSAMNVITTPNPRFRVCGPLLNVAAMDLLHWLDPARVWTPPTLEHNGVYGVDLLALGHPESTGYLAIKINKTYLEFRIPASFDRGLSRATVLIHEIREKASETKTVLLARDRSTWDHEWQPGHAYSFDVETKFKTGVVVKIVSFSQMHAHLTIEVSTFE